jgi:hypothetical protein
MQLFWTIDVALLKIIMLTHCLAKYLVIVCDSLERINV